MQRCYAFSEFFALFRKELFKALFWLCQTLLEAITISSGLENTYDSLWKTGSKNFGQAKQQHHHRSYFGIDYKEVLGVQRRSSGLISKGPFLQLMSVTRGDNYLAKYRQRLLDHLFEGGKKLLLVFEMVSNLVFCNDDLRNECSSRRHAWHGNRHTAAS